MADADDQPGFRHLSDGTTLLCAADGSVRSVQSETDSARLLAMSDTDIERLAATDPDHPALDDAFWAGVDTTDSVRLDADVLAYFRAGGDGYEVRINAALREAMRKRGV